MYMTATNSEGVDLRDPSGVFWSVPALFAYVLFKVKGDQLTSKYFVRCPYALPQNP